MRPHRSHPHTNDEARHRLSLGLHITSCPPHLELEMPSRPASCLPVPRITRPRVLRFSSTRRWGPSLWFQDLTLASLKLDGTFATPSPGPRSRRETSAPVPVGRGLPSGVRGAERTRTATALEATHLDARRDPVSDLNRLSDTGDSLRPPHGSHSASHTPPPSEHIQVR